jgi:hypothetical protein
MMSAIIFNGVRLSTRASAGSFTRMMKVVNAIEAMYETALTSSSSRRKHKPVSLPLARARKG